jgi:transcriptional regulator with XRE-family HTH domain
MPKISEIVANLMLRHGKCSEYELARFTGISQSTINRIVSGEVEVPSTDSLKKLSDFFQLTPEQLLGNEPIQKIKIFPINTLWDLQQILQRLMDISNITEQELAKHTSVAQSTINRILNGQTVNPRGCSLRLIADFFKITVSQLMGIDQIDFLKITDNELLTKVGLKKIPIIDFNSLFNLGKILSNKKSWKTLEIALVETKNSDDLFATIVPNDSMNPEFDSGSILIANKSMRPSDGDYAVLKRQDGIFISELSVIGKKYYMQSNSKSQSLHLVHKDEILGIIVESRKSFIRE